MTFESKSTHSHGNPNNEITTREEDENDDLCWEPLSMLTSDDASRSVDERIPAGRGVAPPLPEHPNQNPPPPRSSSFSGGGGAGGRNSHPSNRSFASNQSSSNTTTTNLLREKLVDHPLHLFWSHFFVNLMQQLWELDLRIRIGLTLILMGIVLNIIVISLSFMSWWHPKTIIVTSLLIISFFYLDPLHLVKSFDQLVQAFHTTATPEAVVEFLELWDMTRMRHVCFGLWMIPTLLEARTLVYLVATILITQQQKPETIRGGWFFPFSAVVIFVVLSSLFWFFLHSLHWSPRDSWHKGLLVLYGSAVWVCIVQLNVQRLPMLAAPFCWSTGTLLLCTYDLRGSENDDNNSNNNWLSDMIRRALRLTLRDTLSTMSANVQQDEMLQMLMLRWIVDYWTGAGGSSETTTSNNDIGTSVATDVTTPIQSQRHDNQDSTTTTTLSLSSNNNLGVLRPSPPPPRRDPFPMHELQWDEMWSMLTLATDQMQSEVPSLQQPRDNSTLPPASTSSSQSSSSSSSTPRRNNESVHNIKVMLSSMDVDVMAKPAVLAYKRAVEAFPPSRRTAIFLSIVRRGPATLTWLWFYLVGKTTNHHSYHDMWSVTLILLPFVVLEYLRLQQWMVACGQLHQASLSSSSSSRVMMMADETAETDGTNSSTNTLEDSNNNRVSTNDNTNTMMMWKEMDPMTILLSEDHYTTDNPPTLMIVWANVVSSVSALEMGLRAARCLYTTAVAAEFAHNIMSLAELGVQVSQHGWYHGLNVLLQEWLQRPSNAAADHGRDHSHDNHHHRGQKYTAAAVNAFRQGQIVARNLRVMATGDDHEKNPTFVRLWQFVTMVLGHVALISPPENQQHPSQRSTASTVEIIEIIDDEDHPLSSTSTTVVTDNSISSSIIIIEPELSAETTTKQPVQNIHQSFPSFPDDRVKDHEDVTSSAMELVATCCERGLISENEKNRYVGSLSGCEWQDDHKREADAKRIQISLRELLQSNSLQPLDQTGSVDDVAFDTTESSMYTVTNSENNLDTDHEVLADSFATTLLTKTESFDDITSDQSPDDLAPQHALDRQTTKSDAEGEKLEQVHTDNRQLQGGDDWLKWVGGGLAVVGAVVGGVALVNAVQGNSQGQPSRRLDNERRANSSSAVRVELLGDDDEQGIDEWVSVSRS